MLVPSTLTGWYRKMMISAEATTDTTKSRSQECITPLPCPDPCSAGLFSGLSPACPSISMLSPDLPHLDVLTDGTQPKRPPLDAFGRPASTANQFRWTSIYISRSEATT